MHGRPMLYSADIHSILTEKADPVEHTYCNPGVSHVLLEVK